MDKQKREKKQDSITNRTGLKRFILAQAKEIRPGWECKHVSSQALNQIEIFLREKIKESLHSQPSIGKTYMQFY